MEYIIIKQGHSSFKLEAERRIVKTELAVHPTIRSPFKIVTRMEEYFDVTYYYSDVGEGPSRNHYIALLQMLEQIGGSELNIIASRTGKSYSGRIGSISVVPETLRTREVLKFSLAVVEEN